MRHPLGVQRWQSWRTWTRAVAAELGALGYGNLGEKLRRCGAVSRVATCAECGDAHAAVEVPHSCDVRVCVWCARAHASEQTARVGRAVKRVPGVVAERRALVAALVDRDQADVTARGDRWRARRGPRAVATMAGVAAELGRLGRAREGLRRLGRGAWGWKLLVVSPQWEPGRADSFTVAGLRARLDDVTARWRALWETGLSVAGLAAAYTRVELSPSGHVHLHALYYGPRWEHAWLTRVAGCHVWVEAVADGEQGDAIREGLKYTLKTPTPSRPSWIAGEGRWMAHPALAARWVLATRHRKLCQPYGTMTAAIGAEDDQAEQPPSSAELGALCATCGAELGRDAWRHEATSLVARTLGRAWSLRPSSKLRGLQPLPARVRFVSGAPRAL